jgi:hypothetical protein
MGNPTIIWTIASALAAACFARGLALRTSQPHPWELLWYTSGIVILASAALLWASVESGVIMQQRIILGFLGGLVGSIGLITIGEVVRPASAGGQETINLQARGKPLAEFAQNVTSYNQSGGITAGTVNIGPQPRHMESIEASPLKNQLLTNLPRDKPIVVMAVMGDAEAMQFAQEIAKFLNDNHFPLKENGKISQGVFAGPLNGIELREDEATRTLIVGAN